MLPKEALKILVERGEGEEERDPVHMRIDDQNDTRKHVSWSNLRLVTYAGEDGFEEEEEGSLEEKREDVDGGKQEEKERVLSKEKPDSYAGAEANAAKIHPPNGPKRGKSTGTTKKTNTRPAKAADLTLTPASPAKQRVRRPSRNDSLSDKNVDGNAKSVLGVTKLPRVKAKSDTYSSSNKIQAGSNRQMLPPPTPPPPRERTRLVRSRNRNGMMN